jgi:hypothetical protein
LDLHAGSDHLSHENPAIPNVRFVEPVTHGCNLALTHRGNDPSASSSRPNRRARGSEVIVEIGRATKQPIRTPKR